MGCTSFLIESLVLRPFEELTKELSAAAVSISIMIHLIATLEKNISEFDEADEHIGNTITDTIGFSEILWLREEALVHHATFIDHRYKNTFFGNKSLKNVS